MCFPTMIFELPQTQTGLRLAGLALFLATASTRPSIGGYEQGGGRIFPFNLSPNFRFVTGEIYHRRSRPTAVALNSYFSSAFNGAAIS